ncbi:hypothetical protein [Streptomyces sp. ISL-94]|uniref:hypothetical protein n=1 Tax=Streptomyces sp. ISL-94 TaxID=2819190 RepID=UPI001BE8C3F9|nr:hypothetical protein [Streptomyces sp. ISL-94]MBT2477622.1 hypothetical protein [Streptomyces sp. ISL-94]
MMDVVGYRLHRRHRGAIDRIEAVADQAVQLVTRKMREGIDPLRIVVTDSFGIDDHVLRNDAALLGTSKRQRLTSKSPAGRTSISEDGVLVVINAERCPADENLDVVLVHELVHAAQLSRPGAREEKLRHLRNNHGVEKLTRLEAWGANWRISADEREAGRLEYLASKLR